MESWVGALIAPGVSLAGDENCCRNGGFVLRLRRQFTQDGNNRGVSGENADEYSQDCGQEENDGSQQRVQVQFTLA